MAAEVGDLCDPIALGRSAIAATASTACIAALSAIALAVALFGTECSAQTGDQYCLKTRCIELTRLKRRAQHRKGILVERLLKSAVIKWSMRVGHVLWDRRLCS